MHQVLVYLPSRNKPNSKAAAVVRELRAAGLDAGHIWTSSKSALARLNMILHGLSALPWTISFILLLRWRAPGLGEMERFLLLTRAVHRRFLRRHPAVVPLIISDVSPDRHALWSAAAAENRAVIWWQDDHHHTEALDYPVQAAAVIGMEGYANVKARSPSAFIAARPPIRPVAFQEIPASPRVGIAMNSFFRAAPEDRRLLEQIRTSLNAAQLYLRLHPNTKVSHDDLPEDWVVIAPPQEELQEFVAKIDVAVVGNSTIQLKLLCSGIPVVHFPFTDVRGFDKHRFHAMGFTCGSADVGELSLDAARSHYRDPELPRRIADYVSIPETEGLKTLSELVEALRSGRFGQALPLEPTALSK